MATTSRSAKPADDGWTVETFATCDPAEFDPAVDDQLNVEIWLDPESQPGTDIHNHGLALATGNRSRSFGSTGHGT